MQPVPAIDEGKTVHQQQFDRSVQATFRNLSFGKINADGTQGLDNISGYWWTGVSSSSMDIVHNLGHVPFGFIVASKSAACDVYLAPGVTPNPTATDITLAASVAGVNLSIFVLG